jgi:hypothetical protein
MTDLLARIWFWSGILAVGFAWGVACVHYKVFPYALLVEAREAARAWRVVIEDRPATFVRYEDSPVPSPGSLGAGAAGAHRGNTEYILVGGGPVENLAVCPRFGCLAWIIDRQGRLMHSWQIDPQAVIDGMHGYAGKVTHNNLKAHDWHLSENGDLTVIFESDGAYPYGGSLARFDWDGNLLWTINNRAHHWMTIDASGIMYVPAQTTVRSPLRLGNSMVSLECPKGGLELDSIDLVGPDGAVIEKVDVVEILLTAGYVGLLEATTDPCDPLHLNFVEVVEPALAAPDDDLAPGDLIVSLRNLNSIMLLDGRDRRIKWMLAGRAVQQHSPRLTRAGDLVLFDNLGGSRRTGGSRIALTRVGSQRVETIFPTDQTDPDIGFYSSYGGHIELHPHDGRALISLTTPGRILEIDLGSGEVLWEYTKQFPSSGYPGAGDRPYVRVEAYGGYYVNQPSIIRNLRLQQQTRAH